eukprot:191816_1
METELAIANQQEFNTRNHQTIFPNEVKDEEDSSLYLGNQKKKSKEIYEFTYRLHMLTPFTILTAVSYALLLSNYYPITIIVLVYNGCVFLCCLFVMFYGRFIYKHSLKQCANELFGIRIPADANNENIFYFEERHYAGLWLLMVISYTTCLSIIQSTLAILRICAWLPLTVYTRLSALVLNLVFLILYRTVKCHPQIMVQKESILTKYKKIQKIDAKIHQRLLKWRNDKRFTNRKLEYAAICIVVCWTNVIWATWGWGLWDQGALSVLWTIIYLIDIIVFSYIPYSMHTLYLHCKLGSIIMEELGLPINSESVTELVGWWQLRKFYSNCIVNHYTTALPLGIGLLLLAAAVLIMFLFVHTIDWTNGTIYWRFMIDFVQWLCWVLLLAFLLVSNAVKYLGNQLSHSNMINEESVALETKNWKSNTPKDIVYQIEMQHKHYIIDGIVKNIERDSVAISVFGIKMNHTFMSVLKTAVGSL